MHKARDDQLRAILAHELSHQDLNHGAGYPKDMMIDTLTWLLQASGPESGGFFATHPGTADRSTRCGRCPDCRTVVGAVLFWALGISAPVLWGTLMTMVFVLPAVGPCMVWTRAAPGHFIRGGS